jgi:hypothetical protein
VPVDEHDSRHLVREAELSQQLRHGGAGGQVNEGAAVGSDRRQIVGERREELDFDVQTSWTSTVSGRP